MSLREHNAYLSNFEGNLVADEHLGIDLGVGEALHYRGKKADDFQSLERVLNGLERCLYLGDDDWNLALLAGNGLGLDSRGGVGLFVDQRVGRLPNSAIPFTFLEIFH